MIYRNACTGQAMDDYNRIIQTLDELDAEDWKLINELIKPLKTKSRRNKHEKTNTISEEQEGNKTSN